MYLPQSVFDGIGPENEGVHVGLGRDPRYRGVCTTLYGRHFCVWMSMTEHLNMYCPTSSWLSWRGVQLEVY